MRLTHRLLLVSILAVSPLIAGCSAPHAPLVEPLTDETEVPRRIVSNWLYPINAYTLPSSDYPEELTEGQPRQLTYRALVGRSGAVLEVELQESSGLDALDAAGLAYAQRLRYEPQTRAGEPVEIWLVDQGFWLPLAVIDGVVRPAANALAMIKDTTRYGFRFDWAPEIGEWAGPNVFFFTSKE